MAKVDYAYPVENIQGTLGKDGAICRRKRFKVDERGHYVEGKSEVYLLKNPRNWEKTPATAGELAHQELFRWAAQETKSQMANAEQAAHWQERFMKQLQKPEPGNSKCYKQIKAFVRAMLMKEVQV